MSSSKGMHMRVPTFSIGQTLATILVALLGSFFFKLVKHRLAWRAQRLPGPPHSFLWGNLIEMNESAKACNMPPDASFDYAVSRIVKKYGSVCYLDLWPFARPLCIISKSSTADKILRIDKLPKDLPSYALAIPTIGPESMIIAGVRAGCPDYQRKFCVLK